MRTRLARNGKPGKREKTKRETIEKILKYGTKNCLKRKQKNNNNNRVFNLHVAVGFTVIFFSEDLEFGE